MTEEKIRDLITKAQKPGEIATKWHRLSRGKIQITAKCPINSLEDLSVWYTPGVAAPCREIEKNKERVYELTNKWNTIAVITDGSRVLGLGNIGPEAGLPVMEGKALLFKYLGGVDAVPICLDTNEADDIIRAVKWLQPSFAGINLEDLANPKCFYILDTLRNEMSIPVWHDDQQGTAVVTLAGLINALKVVGKSKKEVGVTVIGVGAANVAIARMLIVDGFKPERFILVDSKGILHRNRKDLEISKIKNPYKWEFCEITNQQGKTGGIAEALVGTDVCIALSGSGPGIIRPEWVKTMADNAIIFACANPVPEIWPWEAKETGAKVVATGRSDFPNQVNNSLAFPAIFRGALDVQASSLTDEMLLAAAYELARCAEEKGLSEDYIIPSMEEGDVFIREAVAVGLKAIEQGVARNVMSQNQLFKQAKQIIENSRDSIEVLMRSDLIQPVVK